MNTPKQRPTAVSVLGIMNLVFAGIGLLGLIGSAVIFSKSGAAQNPVLTAMDENPAYATWLKLSIPMGAVSSIMMLLAGIGLLSLKDWGRKLSIAYAVYAILLGITGITVCLLYFVRPMLLKAQQVQGPEAAGLIGGAIGGTIGGALGLIYPIVLLVFMFRPKIVAAFRPAIPPHLPVS